MCVRACVRAWVCVCVHACVRVCVCNEALAVQLLGRIFHLYLITDNFTKYQKSYLARLHLRNIGLFFMLFYLYNG